MNSVHQLLFMSTLFRNYFLHTTFHCSSSVSVALQRLFASLFLSSHSFIDLFKFLSSLPAQSLFHESIHSQEDAAEFLKFLLSFLEKEELKSCHASISSSSSMELDAVSTSVRLSSPSFVLPSSSSFDSVSTALLPPSLLFPPTSSSLCANSSSGPSSTSPLLCSCPLLCSSPFPISLFRGSFIDCVRCLTCGHYSVREETFLDLALPLDILSTNQSAVAQQHSSSSSSSASFSPASSSLSLSQLLFHFLSTELLSGENAY